MFTGYRGGISDILAAVDFLLHPSRSGSSLSVLAKATAAALPIIASDVDGIPECVG